MPNYYRLDSTSALNSTYVCKKNILLHSFWWWNLSNFPPHIEKIHNPPDTSHHTKWFKKKRTQTKLQLSVIDDENKGLNRDCGDKCIKPV